MIRVPVCARVSCVSRVCPGSPRCLFTGTPYGSLAHRAAAAARRRATVARDLARDATASRKE